MLTSARISLMFILASFLAANSQGSQDPEISGFNSIKVSANSSSEDLLESSSDSSLEASFSSSEILFDATSDYSFESSSDFSLEASSDFSLEASSDSTLETSSSSSEILFDATSGSSFESSSDPSFEAPSSSSELLFDATSGSSSDSSFESSSDPSSESSSDPSSESSSDPSSESSSDPSFESSSETSFESSSETSFESSSDPSFESSSDPSFESSSGSSFESSSESSSDSSFESSSETSFESSSGSSFESSSDPSFESSSDSSFEAPSSSSEILFDATSGSSSDPSFESSSDPSFESSSGSSAESSFESSFGSSFESSSGSSAESSFEASSDSTAFTWQNSTVSSDSIEVSTQFDNFSGADDFKVASVTEILSGDSSSEAYIVPANPTTESVLFSEIPMDEITASLNHKETTIFPSLNEPAIEINSKDATEAPLNSDVSFMTEEVEMAQTMETASDDMSLEKDITPSSATSTTESVLFSEIPTDEIPASSDHKGTTALPGLTKTPVKPSIDNAIETTDSESISFETEDVEVTKQTEELWEVFTSELHSTSSSPATPTTESISSSKVPMGEIPVSPNLKETKESSDIITTPVSDDKVFILPSTTSNEFVDSSDSINLPKIPISKTYNSSRFMLGIKSQEKKTRFELLFGVILGSVVGTALLATVAFTLYKKRKNSLFEHHRFFDDSREPVHRLDISTDTFNLSFGGSSFFKPADSDDPAKEKNTKKVGENIQMVTIPTAHTLHKPWGTGHQIAESHFSPKTV